MRHTHTQRDSGKNGEILEGGEERGHRKERVGGKDLLVRLQAIVHLTLLCRVYGTVVDICAKALLLQLP